MKKLIFFLLVISAWSSQAQSSQKFNLGFEEDPQHEGQIFNGWMKWGAYELTMDAGSHTGNLSGKITSDAKGSTFGSIAYKIPANYKGTTIKLEGYMKLKNVEGGFAGLLMRVDGEAGPLAFDNMESRNISGTKDWEKYSITLDYSEEAVNIYVAGILVGKGEAWFDDFVLTIDGQDVQNLKEAEKPVYKASLDKEFDKGSNIKFPPVTTALTFQLEKLGRVWGFLKYHHPEIAKGNYNWDYELFRFLPKYLQAKHTKERNQLLVSWIDDLGEVPICKTCEPTDSNAFHKPDLSWIQQYKFGLPLQEKLQFIYANRNQDKHYYIKLAPYIGNPVFKNEAAYGEMNFPDQGFRLLTLYRYWNMIQYFFPYKHLMDKDWNQVLPEYIPSFLNASDELAYELAAIQMIGDVQDTHANLWGGTDKISEWKGTNYPPVHVRFVENQLVVTDYYNPELKKKVGLDIGDVITKINGKSIDQLVKEKSQYYPASNKPTQLGDIATDLLRSNLETIEIVYKRDALQDTQMEIPLYPRDSLNIYNGYRRDTAKCFKLLANNIGYVTLGSIKEEDIPVLKESFKDTKGIIIDIRNYPSTFVPFSLGSFFVSDPTPFVKFTSGNIHNPGEFTFGELLEIPPAESTYQGKLIVLVNDLSVSQSEYTAMAFRAGDNTTVIGSTTAGADGNVSPIQLPGGLKTMISGIGVYYPNGEETQRVGIVPDVEVTPTVAGIRKGKDEVLEKAIEVILK